MRNETLMEQRCIAIRCRWSCSGA